MNWATVKNFLAALFLEPDDPVRRDQMKRVASTDQKLEDARKSLEAITRDLDIEREGSVRHTESIQALVRGLRGATPRSARSTRPDKKRAQKG